MANASHTEKEILFLWLIALDSGGNDLLKLFQTHMFILYTSSVNLFNYYVYLVCEITYIQEVVGISVF